MKTNQHKIAIIGVGLIGASFARDMRVIFPDSLILGADENLSHLEIALQERIIDLRTSVEEAAVHADIIIVSIPVHVTPGLLNFCLSKCKEDALVFDTGSTKESICSLVQNHLKRKNFLAAHPIAGTEQAGPLSSQLHLFKNKTMILCETEKTDQHVLQKANHLFQQLGMLVYETDAKSHDQQLAVLSHLSHVIAYCLSVNAQKIESDQTIQQVAGSGFASTVRLAQSKSTMWIPIFLDNKNCLLEAIEGFEMELQAFKIMLQNEKNDELRDYLCRANRIGKMIRQPSSVILN